MNKVWLVLRKELKEIFQQRPLIYSLCVVPLIIVIISGIVFYSTHTTLLKPPPNAQISATAAIEAAQVSVGNLFRMYILIEPLFIPAMIAAYSIVGEKNSHTLEPLLATPLETWQLLMAKSLSAMLPAIAATWISAGLFTFEMAIFSTPGVIGQVITPGYLILLLLAAPVLTLTPVALTVMASSRFNEPRAAAQISSVIFVVLVLIFSRVGFGQVIKPTDSYLATIILLVVGIGLFWIAVGIFQRESILTRWK
jgi:ABC-2 type transport system permease protein